jgi:hypothetical protein
MNGEEERKKCTKYFNDKSTMKRPFCRPRRRWDFNIKIHIIETGNEDME